MIMSKLEQLINELCPNGVEWKSLGDIGNVCMCKRIMKHETNTVGGIPFYKIGTFGKEADAFISTDLYVDYKSRFSFPNKGEILISASGTIGRSVIYDGRDAYFQDSNIVWLQNNEKMVLNKYLYYCYQIIDWNVEGGTIKRLYNNNIIKARIPIPPLPVQEEIVRILDAFTDYTAELQAELQARREQYEYYRDKLLSFEDDSSVEWLPMGDVGEFIRGNGLQKKDFTESGVGCIHYGQIYTHYGTWATKTKTFCSKELAEKVTPVKPGNLVIACTSENIEDVCKAVAWIGNEDIVTGGHAAVFCHEQDPKFISYLFQTEYFFQQKRKYAQGTKVIDIKTRDMAKIPIPIPPLSEQKRIVAILDKFEALVNDLTEGLPAEIAARQEQYEYYRDKLLNFPKAV